MPLSFRLRVIAILSLVFGGLALCAAGQDFRWLKRNLWDRIQISGSRTLGYHQFNVSGDREAFETLNLYGQAGNRFSDYGALDISGRKVLGFANFQARIETGRFTDPQAQKWSLDYKEGAYDIHVGDTQGSLLNTNRFASFNKTLKGASAAYRSGRFAVKGLYSEAKGSARTVSIQGNNSSGPYYLQVGQLVRGSEEVRLDGQTMVLGQDYVINYELGAITFISRIIAPTSTILVSFEVFGFNADRGTVEGVSTTYDFGKYGKYGLTHMRQKTGAGSSLSQRVELFQGAGAPSTPYFLLFEPLITRPITVKLDGIIQTEGLDYRFDIDNPAIFYFLRFVPLSSTIEVVYTPKPTQTVVGDREVTGFDVRLPLGKGRGLLSYSQAEGKLVNSAVPQGGTARGVDGQYKLGIYDVRASWREIPDGFVSVESRGFNRNEDAVEFSIGHQGKRMFWEAGYSDYDVSLRRTLSSGQTTFSRSANSNGVFRLTDNRRVGEPWRYEANHFEAESSLGKSKLDTLRVGTTRNFGKLNSNIAVEFQQGRGPISNGTTTSIQDIALQTLRSSHTYALGEDWLLNGQVSFSIIRAGDDSGLGKDLIVNLGYEPSDRLALSLGFTQSDSGQVAALSGFQTGIGTGYNGNGFSGGIGTPSFETGVTDFRQVRASGTWRISDRVVFAANLTDSRYAGSVSSNTSTRAFDVGLDWQLSSNTILYLNAGQSDTDFLGSSQTNKATTLAFGLTGQPSMRWSYDVRSQFVSSEGTTFNQDDFGLEGSVTYVVDPKSRVFALGRFGRTTGLFGQDDASFEMGYAYQIWKPLTLVGTYRYRDVQNADAKTAGSYRASGFDLQLRFGF